MKLVGSYKVDNKIRYIVYDKDRNRYSAYNDSKFSLRRTGWFSSIEKLISLYTNYKVTCLKLYKRKIWI